MRLHTHALVCVYTHTYRQEIWEHQTELKADAYSWSEAVRVLQSVCHSVLQHQPKHPLRFRPLMYVKFAKFTYHVGAKQACFVMLRCVAVCGSVLQCVVVCGSVWQCVAMCCSVLQCVAVCCSVLQCVAVCCSVMQCVAVCCSVLQSVPVIEVWEKVHLQEES